MNHFQASYWSFFQTGFIFLALALTLLFLLSYLLKKHLTTTLALVIGLSSFALLLAQANMTVFAGILKDEFNLTTLSPILFLTAYSTLIFLSQVGLLFVSYLRLWKTKKRKT